MSSLLVAFMAAGAVLLLTTGFAMSRTAAPTTVKDRLDKFGTRPRTLEEIELEAPFTERILRPLVRQLSRIVARFTPSQTIERTRKSLILAGNPNNLSVNDFLGIRGLACLVMGGLGFLAGMSMKQGPTNQLMFLGVGAMLGFLLPGMWLGGKISARQNAIVKALPDALDLLTISVEAGLGFDSALSKVVEKWTNPLTLEFERVIAEIRMGRPRREALRDMITRTEVPDVTTFITAVIQADQLGVSMVRVLQVQSNQMRIRRRQRAEQKAQQAPIKMIFPMIFLIFPAMFIVILGPSVPGLLKVIGSGGLGG